MKFLQREYKNFVSKGIYDFFKDMTFEYKGIEVEYKPNTEKIMRREVFVNSEYNDKYSTPEEALLTVDIKVTDKMASTRDKDLRNPFQTIVVPDVKLCTFPLLSEEGFKKGSESILPISKYTPASGWYFTKDKELLYSNPFGDVFKVFPRRIKKAGMSYVVLNVAFNQRTDEGRKGIKVNTQMRLMDFIRALTGDSYETIYEKLPYDIVYDTILTGTTLNSKGITMTTQEYQKNFSGEQASVEACCSKLFSGITTSRKDEETIVHTARSMFKRFSLAGPEKSIRLRSMFSANRFVKSYVKSSELPKELGFTEPYVCIDRKIANKLDEALQSGLIAKINIYDDINDSKPYHKIFTPKATSALTADELYAVLNEYILFLTEDIGQPHHENDHANLVVTTYITHVKFELEKILNVLENDLFSKFSDTDDQKSLKDVTASLMEELIRKRLGHNNNLPSLFYRLQHKDKKNLNAVFVQPQVTNSIANAAQSHRIMKIESNIYREIDPSQYGLIDEHDTPETSKTGINVALCEGVVVDEYNMLAKKVYKVVNGKVLKDKIYTVNPVDLTNRVQASANALDNLNGERYVRDAFLNGTSIDVLPTEVDYQLVSVSQTRSATANYVIFANCDGFKRQPMIISAINASIPTLKAQQPLVRYKSDNTTGCLTLKDIIRVNLAEYGIDMPDFDTNPDHEENLGATLLCFQTDRENHNIVIKFALKYYDKSQGNFAPYTLKGDTGSLTAVDVVVPFMRGTSCKTLRHKSLVPIPERNDKFAYTYKLSDIVIKNPDVDTNPLPIFGSFESTTSLAVGDEDVNLSTGHIALGENVRVLFKVDKGYNYEDSAIASEDFVKGLNLCITQAYTFRDNNKDRDYTYPKEYLPKLGAYYRPKQTILKRLSMDKTYSEIKLDDKTEGTVISVDVKRRGPVGPLGYDEVEIVLSNTLPLGIGDKISGFHGNKSTIGRIVPRSEMPIAEDGKPIDLILNPEGIIQRENVGQSLEQVTFAIADKKGGVIELDPNKTFNLDDIAKAAEANGIVEQRIINPITGNYYPQKAFIGTCYFTRSSHTSRSKWNACADGNKTVSPVTGQTAKGQGGGQTKGEMEQDAYVAANATGYAQGLSTIQSDNSYARELLKPHFSKYPLNAFDPDNKIQMQEIEQLHKSVFQNINNDDTPFESTNHLRLQAYHRFLGYNLVATEDKQYFEVLNSKRIEALTQTILEGPQRSISVGKNIGKVGVNFKNVKDKDNVPTLESYTAWNINSGYPIIMPAVILSDYFVSLFYVVQIKKKSNGDFEQILTTMNRDRLKSLLTRHNKVNNETNERMKVYFAMINAGEYAGIPACAVGEECFAELKRTVNFDLDYQRIATDTATFFQYIMSEYDLEKVLKLDGPCKKFKMDYTPDQLLNSPELPENCTEEQAKEIYESYRLTRQKFDSLDMASRNNFLSPYKFVETYKTGRLIDVFGTLYVMLPPEAFRPGATGANIEEPIGVLSLAIFKLLHSKDFNNTWSLLCNFAGYTCGSNQSLASIKDFNVFSMLTSHKSRTSLYRDTLLAKLVTYSGRSVITIDPKLHIGYCGIPVKMLVTIYRHNIFGLIKAVNRGEPIHVELTDKAIDFCKFFKNEFTDLTPPDVESIYTKTVALALDRATEFEHLTYKEFKDIYQGLKDLLSTIAEYFPQELNRAPTLWRYGSNVFKFKPIEGDAIAISPLACRPYNADFDGDQMCTIGVMSMEGIRDSYKLMFGHDLIVEERKKSVIAINQDMVLGLYVATEEEPSQYPEFGYYIKENSLSFASDDDFIPEVLKPLWVGVYESRYKFSDTIALNFRGQVFVNTIGRILFNSLFGDDGFIFDESGSLKYNEPITKDSIEKLLYNLILNFTREHYEELLAEDKAISNMEITDPKILWAPIEGTRKPMLLTIDRLKDFGFAAVESQNISVSFFDFNNLRNSIKKRLEQNGVSPLEATRHNIQRLEAYKALGFINGDSLKNISASMWEDTIDKVRKASSECIDSVEDGSLNLKRIIRSGARGSVDNIMRICATVGPCGNTVVHSSFLDGLSPVEMHALSYPGRKSQVATQLGAPETGALTRSLKYLQENLTVSAEDAVCNAKPRPVMLRYVASNLTGLEWAKYPEDVEWSEIVAYLEAFCAPKIIETNLCRLLADCEYIYVMEDGKPVRKEVEIEINSTSIQMLLNHAVELPSEFRDLTVPREVDGTIYYFLDYEKYPEIKKRFERAKIKQVEAYTVLGCTCLSDGSICKRCFGITNITKNFYADNYSLGYNSSQMIGENGTQATMNQHKDGIQVRADIGPLILTDPLGLYHRKEHGKPEEIRTVMCAELLDRDFFVEPEEGISMEGLLIPAKNLVSLYRLPVSSTPIGTPLLSCFSIEEMYNMRLNNSRNWFNTAIHLEYLYSVCVANTDLRIPEAVIRALFNNFEAHKDIVRNGNIVAHGLDIQSRAVGYGLTEDEGDVVLLNASYAVTESGSLLASVIRSHARKNLAAYAITKKAGNPVDTFYKSLTHQHKNYFVNTDKVEEVINKKKNPESNNIIASLLTNYNQPQIEEEEELDISDIDLDIVANVEEVTLDTTSHFS